MKNGRRKGDAAEAAAALALARVVVVVWGWICVREDPPKFPGHNQASNWAGVTWSTKDLETSLLLSSFGASRRTSGHEEVNH